MGINVNIYNIILFNLGWIACVLGGNSLAAFAVVTITWPHIYLVSGNWNEWPQLALVTLAGFVFDAALIASGVLQLHTADTPQLLLAFFPPFWMICLWWIFATTLRHSLKWFLDKPLLSIICGSIAGPLTYRTGAHLNGIEFGFPETYTLALLSLSWAFLFPALLYVTNRNGEYHAASKNSW